LTSVRKCLETDIDKNSKPFLNWKDEVIKTPIGPTFGRRKWRALQFTG